MSEFFLELFSEEVPPMLQINARKKLLLDFKNFFQENNISIKGSTDAYSTPFMFFNSRGSKSCQLS